MAEVVVPFAIIAALVLLNAVFVAAEFAIVGAPRTRIEHLANQGHRGARRVHAILEEPRQQDRYIATAQIGITVASLGLGMYGEHVVADFLHPWLDRWAANPWVAAHVLASVISVAGLTYLHIVLGEMVPKTLALQHAARTVFWVTPTIVVLQRILSPLVTGLNGVGNAMLRLVGIRRQEPGADRYHTTEELQLIIEESHQGGLLRGDAGALMRELFEFGDLTAGQVMVPRVQLATIQAGAEPEALRQLIERSPHTRYPVHAGDLDRIIGSLHIKDALRHLVANRPVTAQDARPLPHLPASAALDEVLSAMRRYRSQMAVVMDEHGGTAGLVTIEDLFEEIVGEIDEGRSRDPIPQDPHGRLRVRGTVRLDEVGDTLGVPLAHAAVSTVSGLVLALLKRPAKVGDTVTWQAVTIEVTAVAGRGVGEALATLAPPTTRAGAPR